MFFFFFHWWQVLILGTLLKLHTSLLLVLGPRLTFASFKAGRYKPGITSGPIGGVGLV
jgi:hypothetical protein